MSTTSANDWPALPWAPWKDTCAALHLWTQMVGKYRLCHTPWLNHSWHATLYVTPRGLTTGPIPDGHGSITVDFDFNAHVLEVHAVGGRTAQIKLGAMSIADFWQQFRAAIENVGGQPTMHGAPNELPDPIPFDKDTAPRPYDGEAVQRFHRALVKIERVFSHFRTGFIGKVSPAHLFWGSFDLAVTRFSGRRAPPHPGGIPNLPDAVTIEAYSHEVSSAGFWPGGNGVDEPMFYSYAYPTPEGFAERAVQPAQAFFHKDMQEFVLPYEAVRTAEQPERALLDFLDSTYDAAASLAKWDRELVECALGRPRVPRPVT